MLFITGCTSNKNNYLNYDNTNPVKIEEATSGIDMTELIPSSLNGTIAVKSIELDLSHHLDIGVVYMIEDNLITNLIENNYRVLERDPDALENLYRESTSNYQKEDHQLSNSESIEQDTQSGVNVINVNLGDESSKKNDENSDSLPNEKNTLINTDLTSADYLLSYRVLECGVVYTQVEDDGSSTINLNKIQRNARTRLHCRLTNTKTSEIISAGVIENEISDILDRDDVLDLEQISYQYYHHTLPNQAATTQYYGLTEDSGYATVNEDRPVEKIKDTGKKRPNLVLQIFSAIAALILISA
tara:strand:- start:438 stop:1340 length:903 start_codon:yes stop_codon:yes gene_type:complete